MSKTLFDQHGRQIRTGQKLGTGGEGVVFESADDPKTVIKLYHSPLTDEHASKLQAMVSVADTTIQSVAAWPIGTLHQQPGGRVVGILMLRVSGAVEIHELYSPTARQAKFPDATWKFLIHVAANAARALATLHARNVVMGDVNQKNIMVRTNGTVQILDCDSFQIQVRGRTYLCRVGVPEFTAPELHGMKLDQVHRSSQHDCFGLAILIFHLLFMGRHPYAGRYSGPGDMPLDRAIREGRFAYSSQAQRFQMAPPPRTPTLSYVTPDVMNCFHAAFGSVSQRPTTRPTAAQWAQVLGELAARLVECPKDIGHEYPRGLSTCPWCQLEANGGSNFFYAASIRKRLGLGPAIDVEAIWRDISSTPEPVGDLTFPLPHQQFPLIPLRSTLARRDSPIDQEFLPRLVYAVSLGAAIVTWFDPMLPGMSLFMVPISLAFGGWWGGLIVASPAYRRRRELRKVVDKHASRLKSLYDRASHEMRVNRDGFRSQMSRLKGLYSEHSGLVLQRNSELNRLKTHLAERQMIEHLRRHFIRNATIPGIGAARVVTLASNGIETAFDITETAVLAIDGFGLWLYSSLSEWRQKIESSFVFDPKRGIAQTDIDAIELKHLAARRKIENELLLGQKTLTSFREKARKIESEAAGPLREASHDQQQALQALNESEVAQPKWPSRAIWLALAISVWLPVLTLRRSPVSNVAQKPALVDSTTPSNRHNSHEAKAAPQPTAVPENDSESVRALPSSFPMPHPSAPKVTASEQLDASEPKRIGVKVGTIIHPASLIKARNMIADRDYRSAIDLLKINEASNEKDPACHYLLAIAYRSLTQREAADRAFAVGFALEKQQPLSDWSTFAERIQGPARVWLESQRRAKTVAP